MFGNQCYKSFCLCYNKELIFNAEKTLSLYIHYHLFKSKLWFFLTISFLHTSILIPIFALLAHITFSKNKSSMPSHCSQRQQSLIWPIRSGLVLALCFCISSGTRHPPCSLHCRQTSLPSVPSTHLLPLVPRFCPCCIL